MQITTDVHGRGRTARGNIPGSTSRTISIASFQKGTIVFRPVKLKSSSIKSSVTSQKYSCPGREQNQVIQVSVDVGVDEAADYSFCKFLRMNIGYARSKLYAL